MIRLQQIQVTAQQVAEAMPSVIGMNVTVTENRVDLEFHHGIFQFE